MDLIRCDSLHRYVARQISLHLLIQAISSFVLKFKHFFLSAACEEPVHLEAAISRQEIPLIHEGVLLFCLCLLLFSTTGKATVLSGAVAKGHSAEGFAAQAGTLAARNSWRRREMAVLLSHSVTCVWAYLPETPLAGCLE